jgi:hypothetical protein
MTQWASSPRSRTTVAPVARSVADPLPRTAGVPSVASLSKCNCGLCGHRPRARCWSNAMPCRAFAGLSWTDAANDRLARFDFTQTWFPSPRRARGPPSQRDGRRYPYRTFLLPTRPTPWLLRGRTPCPQTGSAGGVHGSSGRIRDASRVLCPLLASCLSIDSAAVPPCTTCRPESTGSVARRRPRAGPGDPNLGVPFPTAAYLLLRTVLPPRRQARPTPTPRSISWMTSSSRSAQKTPTSFPGNLSLLGSSATP